MTATTTAESTWPDSPPPPWNQTTVLAVAAVLGVLIVFMLIGNMFVILAIMTERDLKRPQYYLILSLAVADLMVGAVVTPLATIYELQRRWTLGVALCDFWISADVLACTSSILHLVAIAMDRYWSITNILYMQRRTNTRIFCMLFVVWAASLLISVFPLFGWKDAEFHERVTRKYVCLISQDLSYQIFSTAAAFYIPLIVIVFIYSRIFKAAKQRLRRAEERKSSAGRVMSSQATRTTALSNKPPSGASALLLASSCAAARQQQLAAAAADASTSVEEERPTETNGTLSVVAATADDAARERPAHVRTAARSRLRARKVRETNESRRERKAWRTLIIITGTFVACWLPFFLLAVARPLCQCQIEPVVESLALWLGYLNSAINPVIYTVFSPDFRQAFNRISKRTICFWQN